MACKNEEAHVRRHSSRTGDACQRGPKTGTMSKAGTHGRCGGRRHFQVIRREGELNMK